MNNSSSTEATQFPPFEAQALEVALTVRDLTHSREWYEGALGFVVDRVHEREGKILGVALRAGRIRILLTPDDGTKGERVKGEGFSIAFTTTQNIDAIAAQAKAAGATFDTEVSEMKGTRFFRLRDPDGFKLVVTAPRNW